MSYKIWREKDQGKKVEAEKETSKAVGKKPKTKKRDGGWITRDDEMVEGLENLKRKITEGETEQWFLFLIFWLIFTDILHLIHIFTFSNCPSLIFMAFFLVSWRNRKTIVQVLNIPTDWPNLFQDKRKTNSKIVTQTSITDRLPVLTLTYSTLLYYSRRFGFPVKWGIITHMSVSSHFWLVA